MVYMTDDVIYIIIVYMTLNHYFILYNELIISGLRIEVCRAIFNFVIVQNISISF